MSTIDVNTLYEAILRNIPKIIKECKKIDARIHCISNSSHIRVMSTPEQCDCLIELLNVKTKLVNLCKAFAKWYKHISDEERELYMKYLANPNKSFGRRIFNLRLYREQIIPMIEDCAFYMKNNTKINEAELIKYPYIHNLYTTFVNYRDMTKKYKKSPKKEWGDYYVNTRNEERHT